ncbi:hypothetical protein PLESTB_001709900 [Pleodorina starrii]|uniref:Uncharacterized protein n=1 Tax=Pleodorina starrii TaxID=330485 RepID=A0A9W6BZA7_9CHLO|nr:hypothetical protein PLESTB_001709900 [Pleodorina starrii]
MVKGHTHLILLGRAASRALSSASSSLAGEGSAAWCASWQRDCGRNFTARTFGLEASTDSIPSTSCSVNQATEIASRQPWSLTHTTVLGSRLWRHGPTVAPLRASHFLPPAPTPAFLRALHVSAPAAAPAANDSSGGTGSGGTGSGGTGGGGGGAAAPGSEPVQNPLQAALAAASGVQPSAQGGLEGKAVKGRRRERRTWMWYDEDDERTERRHERAREQYTYAGTAYMEGITQSVKKMNRIVRLVRGLSYADAVAQCKLVPHKAARHALEAAYQDATQVVGLDGERLVVGIIYATRGRVEKAMQRMGRGRSGRMFTRSSHLRVTLRESRERPSDSPGFRMRTVTPLMGVMTGAAAPAAAWLTRGPAAAARTAQRPRFAYRVEV